MNKIERVNELVKILNQYRDEYYNLNKPSVEDKVYDNLFDELESLEKETGLILSNSPTQTVGAYEVKSKLEKRTHPTPLKSLDKTKSIDELNRWRNNKDIILMLKADGLTIELDYENGLFVNGYTRGNGEIGEVVTHNCRVFKNIPLSIPFKGKLRISGEAVIHKNNFEDINSKLSDDEKYATPRNLVSGSVRQLDSKICSNRNVYFYAFNILECSEELSDSKYENFKWLGEQGFYTIVNSKIYKADIISEEHIQSMKNLAEQMKTPIDGLVTSYDSIKYSNSLLETSHHPLHSLAFKFFDETEETILYDVEWNTTRTGQINPTGIFNTVIIDGTEVSRASLHNLSFIKGLNLTYGCRVLVSKRNLIIPHIEDNLDRDKGIFAIPNRCPSCGSPTEIRNTGTAEFLFCTNKIDCPAQQLDKFVNFVKRDAMNIEGLSEATLEKFLNLEIIKTFSDIYKIDKFKSQIVKLDGFGLKSYNKLWDAIGKSRTVKMENFLVALGINQIGKSAGKSLAKHFKNDINTFLDATISHHSFLNIDDFGSVTAYSIYEYFQLEENMNQVKELLKYITIKQEEKKIESSNSIFSGKKIYGTGTFANYKKEELKGIIENLGAEFASGYAKSLDYLVVGSIKGSSKEEKAKKDGVIVLTEGQFIEMINKN